jgi:putative flavoprotein involved in K+ transport
MGNPVTHQSGSVAVVVIGAGHAGLAISSCLTARAIDHVVLERGQIGNAWTTQRWDSLRLLTPNWQAQLPGYHYQTNDADGYMTMSELSAYLKDYAQAVAAPVFTHTTVKSVTQDSQGYCVQTNRGVWRCTSVVLASGICNQSAIPALAKKLPLNVKSLSPLDYKNPSQLAHGGVLVVGGSATGLQLAEELHRSGRKVTLAVGEHVRMPRVYRGRDIQWWLDQAGYLDQLIETESEPTRAQRLPSPQLIGSASKRTLDLNKLQEQGISVVGRLVGVRENTVQFSGGLRNCCALADLKLNRLLDRLDQWAKEAGKESCVGASERYNSTHIPTRPTLSLDLEQQAIETVVWATGFKPDYSWLKLPVLDRKGKLNHQQGVVGDTDSNTPGLYAMGLSYMRKRKSSFIYGAADDAQHIAAHVDRYLKAVEARTTFLNVENKHVLNPMERLAS